MREETINIYKINELKGKALESATDSVCELMHDDREQFLMEDLKDYLYNEYNIKDADISYDFSYGQGCGVSFEKSNILNWSIVKDRDVEKANIFELYLIGQYQEDSKQWEMLCEYLSNNYNFDIIRKDYHYTHCNTCEIDYEAFYSSDDPQVCDEINDFVYVLSKELKREIYDKICNSMERYGYAIIEEDYSMEDIIDYCDACEYEFTEDGNFWNR